MSLTPEQAQLWREIGTSDPRPSGEQTKEQAIALTIDSFRFACKLEGIEPPSEGAIRAEMPSDDVGKPKP